MAAAFSGLVFGCLISSLSAAPAPQLRLVEISDNRSDYLGESIPRFEKLEVTFRIEDTVAENLQFPFDPEPPPGVEPGIGISVQAEFTPDNWRTVYLQPAFLYQEFEDEIRSGQEWFYPTEPFVWKVRFSPHRAGRWRYRLRAEDAAAAAASPEVHFRVADSANPGFIRVSRQDPRYFEFDDGSYFPALGYNMNFDHVGWRNPILDNRENFETMGTNGIQLIRIWLSQWAIFGVEWNPWSAQDPAQHAAYLSVNGISFEEAFPGSDVSMRIAADWNSCMFIGVWKARPALRRNRDYRVLIRYKTKGIKSPKDPSQPYGFVAKMGGWLWSSNENERCYSPGVGIALTPHQSSDTDGWERLEGRFNSGARDFLPNFFLVMENVREGAAFVDYVSIQEDLGGGRWGPNIVSKPWMAQHQYFEQRNSYAFDKLLELAEDNGIYLRPVVHEKNDRLLNGFNHAGQPAQAAANSEHFYGDWRAMTKVRWLQQAWWRYLQARWGYSPHIHSWELLNEGDPFNGRHFTLADEFGKYMHQFTPQRHLVSTSTWHSFPHSYFWGNPEYSNVDFADVHFYTPRGGSAALRIDDDVHVLDASRTHSDAALATQEVSRLLAGALGAGLKPVIRGETGFVDGGSWPASEGLRQDKEGVWLHNFVWGGVNPGGLIESYWYDTEHIYNRNFDHRPRFRSFFDFIRAVPLNTGYYRDAEATASDPRVRVWGQTDSVNELSHLWIQNTQHTWRNVVEGRLVQPVTATVNVPRLRRRTPYTVQWWNTREGVPLHEEVLVTDSSGNLKLDVISLETDVAVRIGDYDKPVRRRNRSSRGWTVRGNR